MEGIVTQAGNHAFHKVTKFMRNSSHNQILRFKGVYVCVAGGIVSQR